MERSTSSLLSWILYLRTSSEILEQEWSWLDCYLRFSAYYDFCYRCYRYSAKNLLLFSLSNQQCNVVLNGQMSIQGACAVLTTIYTYCVHPYLYSAIYPACLIKTTLCTFIVCKKGILWKNCMSPLWTHSLPNYLTKFSEILQGHGLELGACIQVDFVPQVWLLHIKKLSSKTVSKNDNS